MIGIIGAMEQEVEQLVAAMDIEKTVNKASMKFYSGNLCGKEVTVVRCGVGKVNAAVCTQILIDDFNVDAVINTGIAGSLNVDIDIADVVVSTDLIHHDMNAVEFGYPKGQVPMMETLSFKADDELISIAIEACKVAASDIGIHKGRIVSGDQFIADQKRKEEIVVDFQGLCTEMEGAAIGHAAYLNKVPFVVIRTISDKADNSASVSYEAFEKIAIENSVKIIKEFCSRI